MNSRFARLACACACSCIALTGLFIEAAQATPAPAAPNATSPVMAGVAQLQHDWARIKYQTPDKDQQLDAIHQLETRADALTHEYSDSPEAMIWKAIILSTDAGLDQGLSALGKVRDARALFEQSIKLNPYALNGSAYTSLGSLYYQVPGWPLAFGSNTKAEEFLKKALAINPDGIDPNYFYGDFLLQNKRFEDARAYFQHALAAPDRPDRPVADSGRRVEIKQALAKIDNTLAH
jgi:tetratricopeptide (TPR) repeat protein